MMQTTVSLTDSGCVYVVPVEAVIALITMGYACALVFKTHGRLTTHRFRVHDYPN